MNGTWFSKWIIYIRLKHKSVYFGFYLLISSLLNLLEFFFMFLCFRFVVWFLALNTDGNVKNRKMKEKRRLLCKNNLFNLTISFNLSKIVHEQIENELAEWKRVRTWEGKAEKAEKAEEEEAAAKKSVYSFILWPHTCIPRPKNRFTIHFICFCSFDSVQ